MKLVKKLQKTFTKELTQQERIEGFQADVAKAVKKWKMAYVMSPLTVADLTDPAMNEYATAMANTYDTMQKTMAARMGQAETQAQQGGTAEPKSESGFAVKE